MGRRADRPPSPPPLPDLSERGELGRDPTAVDDALVGALTMLAERHRDARSAPPAVEAAVVDACVSLYDRDLATLPPERVTDAISEQFNRLYYHAHDRTWKATTYRGTIVWKCPIDLWTYQELLHIVEPDLIVETGTAQVGAAATSPTCATSSGAATW